MNLYHRESVITRSLEPICNNLPGANNTETERRGDRDIVAEAEWWMENYINAEFVRDTNAAVAAVLEWGRLKMDGEGY